MDDTKKDTITQKLKELKQLYTYNNTLDIMETDDDTIKAEIAKLVIEYELDDVDRNIILLYADTGCLRRLGKVLGCSHSTIRPEVNRIKNNLQDRINLLYDELF